MAGSVVDGGHVGFGVPLAGGWGEGVQPGELGGGELEAVGGGVLLDAVDAAGAGDRGDVVALGEQPGQGDQRLAVPVRTGDRSPDDSGRGACVELSPVPPRSCG